MEWKYCQEQNIMYLSCHNSEKFTWGAEICEIHAKETNIIWCIGSGCFKEVNIVTNMVIIEDCKDNYKNKWGTKKNEKNN